MADCKAGNLDAAIELDPGFYRSLKGVPGSTSVAAPGLGFHELGFNCWNSPKSKGDPLLRDGRIRQAINWAIDKQATATTTSAGSSTGAIVAIVLAALVVIAIVVFVVMRRRPKRMETE